MRIMKIWSVEPIRRTVYTSISSQTTPIQSLIEFSCDEIFLSSNEIMDISEISVSKIIDIFENSWFENTLILEIHPNEGTI